MIRKNSKVLLYLSGGHAKTNKKTRKKPEISSGQMHRVLQHCPALLHSWPPVGVADDEVTRARRTAADPQQALVRKLEPCFRSS